MLVGRELVAFPPYVHRQAQSDRREHGVTMRLPMIQLALALVVLLNAAISLEDPFDNVGLDGIYIDEAWSDVQQVGLAVGCMSFAF